MTRVEETQVKITEMIQNGEYNSDNYLPSEGELVTRFGVSRVTVREAVRTLEIRGFLKRIHGKGLMVLDNSVNAMTQSLTDMMQLGSCSAEDLIEVRVAIEEACARHAALRATSEDIEILRSHLDAMESAQSMDEAYYHHDFNFHLQLAKATHNGVMLAIVKSYTALLFDNIVQASQTDYCIEAREHYHRNVFDQLLARDAQGAAQAMHRHLVATVENRALFASLDQ